MYRSLSYKINIFYNELVIPRFNIPTCLVQDLHISQADIVSNAAILIRDANPTSLEMHSYCILGLLF